MRKYIMSCFYALLLALPLVNAGAQTIPFFPLDGAPQAPAVPAPQISTTAFIPLEIPDFAFSGQADIEALLESAIRGSKKSVEVALYGFTLPRVAQALVDAKERGVAVHVLVNESHVHTARISEQLELLIDKGLDVRTLRGVGNYGIMHNKLGIYDGKMVSAGSFNWAVTANLANSENIVFSRDKGVVAGYRKYFAWMWGYARPVSQGPGQAINSYGKPPEDPARTIFYNGALLPAYSFSPAGRTEADILNAINFTRESADIAVFSFYSLDIGNAVVNAHKRGVKVRVLVDRVQASQSEVGALLIKNGVPFRWSQGYAGKGVMHNKFAVLDSKLLMTGSFNWSVNAQQNNFENMFNTADKAYTAAFAAQFERLFTAAETPTSADLEKARLQYQSAVAER